MSIKNTKTGFTNLCKMLRPKQHCFEAPKFHSMKYKELSSTLPRIQLWLSKDSGQPPARSLLVRELRSGSRCYGMEHIKGSLWGLRKKRGPLTGVREPVLAGGG